MDLNKEKLAKEIGQRDRIWWNYAINRACYIFSKTLDYMVKWVAPEEGNTDAAYYKEQQFKFLINHMSPEHQEYIKGRPKYYYDLESTENGKAKQK